MYDTYDENGSCAYVQTEEYRSALKFKPDIVVIMLGTNDAKFKYWDEIKYVKDYARLCQSLLRKNTELYIMIPTPMYDF